MIETLFENDEILIIDKPAGLPSQPGEKVGSSVITVVERDFGFVPFPVHRLDKETAGCMMVAKNAAAASAWSSLLAEKAVRKIYGAICVGGPKGDSGSYSEPFSIDGRIQSAVTRYACLSRFGTDGEAGKAFSFLKLELGTGRTHQIRRHMAMHGHPVAGDDKYGDFSLNRQLKKSFGLKHLLLWAGLLEIPGFPPIRASFPPHFTDFLGRFPDAPDMEAF
jgi:23S rRNA pseudouridine955/2504/2580 synthase